MKGLYAGLRGPPPGERGAVGGPVGRGGAGGLAVDSASRNLTKSAENDCRGGSEKTYSLK